jgi:cysteinyl-tRNA synthetase
VTINELLESTKFGNQKWHGRVLKLAMLMTHYRQPIDWTVDRLVDARNNLYEWNMLCHEVHNTAEIPPEVVEPLFDDLNTPGAIAALHSLARSARGVVSGPDYVASRAKLRRALELLGLYEPGPSVVLLKQDVRDRAFDEQVDALVAARVAARAAKNWLESDRLRDEIVALGVVLMDNKDGTTTWEVAR